VHSLPLTWLRWLVVIFALLAVFQAYRAWIGRKPATKLDQRLGMLFSSSLDLQVLVGLILYFVLSPITTGALRNFGGAMANANTRYFLVEHALVMLVAVVLVHVGRSLARRAGKSAVSAQRLAIFYTLAILAILLAIPWPFLPAGRPWIRL
jgi:cytochrome c biogenesis factor